MDTREQITDRQLEVARLISEGRSNPEIANALGVSLAGAKYHVSELLGRLGVSSREEIAEWYRTREGVRASRGWRERLRGLVPIGALVGATAGVALIAVALSGGRDDPGSSAPLPTPTAVLEVVANAGDDDTCLDLQPLGGSAWPSAGGLLQPTHIPDGWEVYTSDVTVTDSCAVMQVRILLARPNAPAPGTAALEEWIAFVQSPEHNPWRQPAGDPVDLAGVTGYQTLVDGSAHLSWSQNGITAGLVGTGPEFEPLIEIARSTSLLQSAPAVTWEPPNLPLFWEYEIQPSDTPEDIAERFGVSVETVIANNIDMTPTGAPNSFVQILTPGTIAVVPTVDGILHSVINGDTVASIAEMYDADERDILEFRANGLDGAPDNLEPGSVILLPGGTKLPGTPSAAAGGDQWTWPVEGDLKTPFGPDNSIGIDIRAPLETEVRAARDGAITFVGGDPCCDEGYHVIIEHEDGYETLYAHLGGFQYAPGAWVNAGDVIGTVGMTGRTDEPHLHFEIRRAGAYQDPLSFLP